MKNKHSDPIIIRSGIPQFVIALVLFGLALFYSKFANSSSDTNRIRSKSGWILTVEGSKSIISDSTGKILGYINIDRNGKVELIKTKEK